MTQKFNRYIYAMNNPLVYVDLSGKKWWKWLLGDILTGGLISTTAITNTALTFPTLAITGATLYSTVVPLEHTAIWLNGFSDPSGAGKRFNNSLMIDGGLFTGNFRQVLSRWTWEFPQTVFGNTYSHFRNMFGNVDRVDHFGGATFATNENAADRHGISIGSYININITDEISGKFNDYVLTDPLFMHEYGHYIDSQIFGISYLLAIGMPSLFSAGNSGDVTTIYNGIQHTQSEYNFRWYERRANKHAAKYFRRYGVDWETTTYKGSVLEIAYPRKNRR